MSNRLRFLTHNGKEIFFIDYSSLRGRDYLDLVYQSLKVIEASGKKDIRLLIDLTNSLSTREVAEAQAEVTRQAKPLVKKITVVGMDPLKRILANVVMNVISDKSFRFSKTLEEGKDWLAEDED